MKKLLIAITLFSTVLLTGVGCLKDKGFEDKEYGTDIIEVKGVAFPQTSSSPIIVGLNSQTTPSIANGPIITLEQDGVASSDVTVTLTINNTLVTDAGLTPLPAGSYTVNTLTVVIPAGQKLADVIKITIPNTTTLNPTQTYGVGFTISSVTGGYTIASNQKNVVIGFTIKNRFDGVWNLRGFHNRPTLDGFYNQTVHLITSGPNSVYMYWPVVGLAAHPIATSSGGLTYYGTFTSNFTFDATTNALLSWDWTPYPTTLPTAVGPATDSRYVPASGGNPARIYAQFFYNNNPGARRFTDTLTYIGPR